MSSINFNDDFDDNVDDHIDTCGATFTCEVRAKRLGSDLNIDLMGLHRWTD
jgi:hypothetical protein